MKPYIPLSNAYALNKNLLQNINQAVILVCVFFFSEYNQVLGHVHQVIAIKT